MNTTTCDPNIDWTECDHCKTFHDTMDAATTVVPMGKARIRTQISAGHTKEDIDFAVKCFGEVKQEMGL